MMQMAGMVWHYRYSIHSNHLFFFIFTSDLANYHAYFLSKDGGITLFLHDYLIGLVSGIIGPN